MRKKERAAIVIQRLKEEYPDADCTLDYEEAWKLLISVRLAAQCTDERVNRIVPGLYEKFPDVDALAQADPLEIEEIVKPCGLGRSKARDISKCMRMLKEEFDSKVPDDFDQLMRLPGVGRKSANLIMGDVFGKPAIVTDTHCIRLCNRIGLVDDLKDPKQVEMALWKIIPPEEGNNFCHRLVFHGREVCTARTRPYCDRCCLSDVCKAYPKLQKEKDKQQKKKERDLLKKEKEKERQLLKKEKEKERQFLKKEKEKERQLLKKEKEKERDLLKKREEKDGNSCQQMTKTVSLPDLSGSETVE